MPGLAPTSSNLLISSSYEVHIVTSDRICTLPGWNYQERPDSSTNAQICTSGRIYQHPPTRERDNVPFQTLNPPYFHQCKPQDNNAHINTITHSSDRIGAHQRTLPLPWRGLRGGTRKLLRHFPVGKKDCIRITCTNITQPQPNPKPNSIAPCTTTTRTHNPHNTI